MKIDQIPSGLKAYSCVSVALTVILTLSVEVQSQSISRRGMLFTDVTLEAGIDFRETIGDETMTNIVESAGVGCAFLDYDSDGWMDIYLVSGCWMDGLSDPGLDEETRNRLARFTDRLYRNRGDGTFEDVTESAGVARPAYGMGVIAADYDGDGDPDLYITNYGPNFLYRNNGDGTFEEVAAEVGVAGSGAGSGGGSGGGFSVGAVFFDYNLDGRLDLYVGHYVEFDPGYTYHYAPDGFPGPLAYSGQQDRLYRGNPDGTFTDVTEASGISIEPIGRAMGVGVFDYDGDRLPDIFVSNDAMENFLFHNNGDGTFENRALETFVAYGQSGEATAAMAVEIADIGGDGRFDVLVPDMAFSCLYRFQAEGFFEDNSVRSGIAVACGQYASWGGVFADFDLDGHLDLYISNGDVHHLETQEDLLFLGDGRGRFEDVSETAGKWATQKFVSRGAAGADFDNDGDIDILVASLNDRPVLLRNDSPRGDRHWLGVSLIGNAPNTDAIGATVRLTVGEETMIRTRRSGGSYLSQHDPRMHFGLGAHQVIDRLEIIWPDGSSQRLENIPSDRYMTIRQAFSDQ